MECLPKLNYEVLPLYIITHVQPSDMILTLFIIGYIIFYIICGILSYGFLFAYFQREYPTIAKKKFGRDSVFAHIMALFGPIALLDIFLTGTYKHGLLFFPEKK